MTVLLVAGLLVCAAIAIASMRARFWPSLTLSLGAFSYGSYLLWRAPARG